MTSTAERIHANPDLLRFIPNERFKNSLRATVAGSMRGTTATTGLISAHIKDGLIHIWTWHADPADFSAQRVAQSARQMVYREPLRVQRTQDREEFLSVADQAGLATHTVYRKIPK